MIIWKRIWAVLALMAMVGIGCSSPPAPGPVGGGGTGAPPAPSPEAPSACQPGNAAAYFPYRQGAEATFAGKGNEYASFKLRVIQVSGDKVEWRKDTGGTVMAEVFQVTPDQVTLLYREGEAYDDTPRMSKPPNQSEVILKGPIQVGTEWVSGQTKYRITAVDETVQALDNQTLSCVLVVEAQYPDSVIRNYYHMEYGWVLSIFSANGTEIESRLAAFRP